MEILQANPGQLENFPGFTTEEFENIDLQGEDSLVYASSNPQKNGYSLVTSLSSPRAEGEYFDRKNIVKVVSFDKEPLYSNWSNEHSETSSVDTKDSKHTLQSGKDLYASSTRPGSGNAKQSRDEKSENSSKTRTRYLDLDTVTTASTSKQICSNVVQSKEQNVFLLKTSTDTAKIEEYFIKICFRI